MPVKLLLSLPFLSPPQKIRLKAKPSTTISFLLATAFAKAFIPDEPEGYEAELQDGELLDGEATVEEEQLENLSVLIVKKRKGSKVGTGKKKTEGAKEDGTEEARDRGEKEKGKGKEQAHTTATEQSSSAFPRLYSPINLQTFSTASSIRPKMTKERRSSRSAPSTVPSLSPSSSSTCTPITSNPTHTTPLQTDTSLNSKRQRFTPLTPAEATPSDRLSPASACSSSRPFLSQAVPFRHIDIPSHRSLSKKPSPLPDPLRSADLNLSAANSITSEPQSKRKTRATPLAQSASRDSFGDEFDAIDDAVLLELDIPSSSNGSSSNYPFLPLTRPPFPSNPLPKHPCKPESNTHPSRPAVLEPLKPPRSPIPLQRRKRPLDTDQSSHSPVRSSPPPALFDRTSLSPSSSTSKPKPPSTLNLSHLAYRNTNASQTASRQPSSSQADAFVAANRARPSSQQPSHHLPPVPSSSTKTKAKPAVKKRKLEFVPLSSPPSSEEALPSASNHRRQPKSSTSMNPLPSQLSSSANHPPPYIAPSAPPIKPRAKLAQFSYRPPPSPPPPAQEPPVSSAKPSELSSSLHSMSTKPPSPLPSSEIVIRAKGGSSDTLDDDGNDDALLLEVVLPTVSPPVRGQLPSADPASAKSPNSSSKPSPSRRASPLPPVERVAKIQSTRRSTPLHASSSSHTSNSFPTWAAAPSLLSRSSNPTRSAQYPSTANSASKPNNASAASTSTAVLHSSAIPFRVTKLVETASMEIDELASDEEGERERVEEKRRKVRLRVEMDEERVDELADDHKEPRVGEGVMVAYTKEAASVAEVEEERSKDLPMMEFMAADPEHIPIEMAKPGLPALFSPPPADDDQEQPYFAPSQIPFPPPTLYPNFQTDPFLTLPLSLTSLILSYAIDPSRLTNVSILLTSHLFHSLARPYLYRRVSLRSSLGWTAFFTSSSLENVGGLSSVFSGGLKREGDYKAVKELELECPPGWGERNGAGAGESRMKMEVTLARWAVHLKAQARKGSPIRSGLLPNLTTLTINLLPPNSRLDLYAPDFLLALAPLPSRHSSKLASSSSSSSSILLRGSSSSSSSPTSATSSPLLTVHLKSIRHPSQISDAFRLLPGLSKLVLDHPQRSGRERIEADLAAGVLGNGEKGMIVLPRYDEEWAPDFVDVEEVRRRRYGKGVTLG